MVNVNALLPINLELDDDELEPTNEEVALKRHEFAELQRNAQEDAASLQEVLDQNQALEAELEGLEALAAYAVPTV